MTLPSSGPMTASMINVELGRASNAPFDINGAAERALAGKPSGPIKFSDFYGKSSSWTSATATLFSRYAKTQETSGMGNYGFRDAILGNYDPRTFTVDGIAATFTVSSMFAYADTYPDQTVVGVGFQEGFTEAQYEQMKLKVKYLNVVGLGKWLLPYQAWADVKFVITFQWYNYQGPQFRVADYPVFWSQI